MSNHLSEEAAGVHNTKSDDSVTRDLLAQISYRSAAHIAWICGRSACLRVRITDLVVQSLPEVY